MDSNNLNLTQEQIREFITAARNMSAGNVELSGDGLELFRSVMERRPHESPLGNREYNQADDPDGESKQKILEDFTSEIGCCYTGLSVASDTVLRLSIGEFSMFMLELRKNMGKFPLSIDASRCVAETYAFWKNGVFFGQEEIDRATESKIERDALAIQEEMLQSSARFKLIETRSGYHLSATTFGPCGCPSKEVLCDHGWAARYVLCAIIKPDRRLGGTEIDFNAFFADEDDDEQYTSPFDQRTIIEDSRKKLERLEAAQDITNEIEEKNRYYKRAARNLEHELAEKMPDVKSGNYSGMEALKDQLRLSELRGEAEREISLLIERRRELIESMNRESVEFDRKSKIDLRPPPLQLAQTELAETLIADDSASLITSRESPRRFMEQGTVVANATTRIGRPGVGKLMSMKLPEIQESAIGFVQTEELYAGDVASRQSVIPINGLSKPFGNPRLNLLGHVYTGLNIMNRESESDNLYTTLYNLRKSKLNSPPVQLFRQVLNCTFDWEEGTVKSNPFKLPYIEVGMTISEDCLIKCFDLLNSEYKNLWFSEMKQMQVPYFAQEYNRLSDFSLKGSKRYSMSTGSKTSEATSDDHFNEGLSSKSRGSEKASKHRSTRKSSGSSSRSSVLGFPLR